MTWLRACPLLIIVAAIYFLLTAVRDDRLRLTVEGHQIQLEPGYIRLRIRVEPDPANRALAVGIVGPDFETSSLEQLEGDRAPITRWREFKDIPAGDYQVLSEVYRPSADNWYASTRVLILSRH